MKRTNGSNVNKESTLTLITHRIWKADAKRYDTEQQAEGRLSVPACIHREHPAGARNIQQGRLTNYGEQAPSIPRKACAKHQQGGLTVRQTV